jgi:hypothetical protein
LERQTVRTVEAERHKGFRFVEGLKEKRWWERILKEGRFEYICGPGSQAGKV